MHSFVEIELKDYVYHAKYPFFPNKFIEILSLWQFLTGSKAFVIIVTTLRLLTADFPDRWTIRTIFLIVEKCIKVPQFEILCQISWLSNNFYLDSSCKPALLYCLTVSLNVSLSVNVKIIIISFRKFAKRAKTLELLDWKAISFNFILFGTLVLFSPPHPQFVRDTLFYDP